MAKEKETTIIEKINDFALEEIMDGKVTIKEK